MSEEPEGKPEAPEEPGKADPPPEPADDDSGDPIFTALWKRALEAWDDDGPHRALLEHALKAQLLPDLAGRYRALKDDPAKGPRAQKQIDRIVAAATQLMFATKTPPPTKTPVSWTISAALCFAIVIGYLFYALVLGRR